MAVLLGICKFDKTLWLPPPRLPMVVGHGSSSSKIAPEDLTWQYDDLTVQLLYHLLQGILQVCLSQRHSEYQQVIVPYLLSTLSAWHFSFFNPRFPAALKGKIIGYLSKQNILNTWQLEGRWHIFHSFWIPKKFRSV